MTSAGSCKKTAAQERSEPGSSASPTNPNCFTVTFDGSCSGGGLKRKISQQIPWYIPNYLFLPVRGSAALLKQGSVWKAQGQSAMEILKPACLYVESLNSLTLQDESINLCQGRNVP